MMARRALLLVSLLALLSTLAGTVQAQPPAPTVPAPTALVYVPIGSDQDLARFQATGLPAYTRLRGETETYLLSGADAAGRQALIQAGLSFRILDPDMAGASYYYAYAMPGRPIPNWAAYGRPLLDEDTEVLLRMPPAAAERLSLAGVELQRVTLTPKPLQQAPAGQVFPTAIVPDPLIQMMIDQVTSPTVSYYDRQLAGEVPVWVDGNWYTITTRQTYSGEPIQKTTHWIGQHLAALGLDVEYHVWNVASNPNVIGELPGLTNPEDIFIIGGHVDDVTGTPGADDNASAAVAMMIAADIFTQYQWGCTLRFAVWTGEEQGLLGSEAYATRAHQRGENIVGYLNLDMLAYNTVGSPPGIDLMYRPSMPPTLQLVQLFADVVAAYNLDLVPEFVTSLGGGSDHSSFWDQGYTAILAIEDQNDINPYYHQPGDTPAHTDLAYFTEYVKASLGTFAHMSGCLIPGGIGAIDGHVTAASSGVPISGAVITSQDQAGHSLFTTTNASGYYTRTLLPGTYTVTAAAFGYTPATVAGVQIVTDSVTTQDFSLTLAPTYTVSGMVTEAGTGTPLYAQVQAVGAPLPPAWTDPASGFYSITLPAGTYTLHVTAAIHRPMDREVMVDHDQTQDFALEPLPCILLVDDDGNDPNVRSYYTAALDNLGLGYDVWDVPTQSDPAAADLQGYLVVIWFTGHPYNDTFTGANEDAVAAYLDEGGNFSLSSQDYLWNMGLDPFGQNYLHIASFDGDVSQTTVSGANVYSGLGPYPLSYPFTNYSDLVNPDVSGLVAFIGDHGNAAVSYDGASFNTIFLGFPFEAMSLAGRIAVMERTLAFFGGCELPCDPIQNADFSWTPFTPTVGQEVTFTGVAAGTQPISYRWDLGDGSSASDRIVHHTYMAADDYTVIMTATNDCGQEVVTHQVTVEPCAPLQDVDFAWSPLTPTAGLPVPFTATASGTTPITYAWNLGDGTTASGASVDHTYTAGGDYLVTMTATNPCDEEVVQYTVHVCAPLAHVDFSWTPPDPVVGEVITFTASASGTAPISYAWSFGDGQLGSGIAITHVYTASGDYAVQMAAVNACSDPVVVSYTIHVCAPLDQVDFAWTPLTPVVGEAITFTASASGTAPISFSWGFGDGTTGQGAVVTHTFAQAGTHTVTLTATNCGPAPATVVHTLTVALPCTPPHLTGLTWAPITPTLGQAVAFTATATGTTPITFTWDFGDDTVVDNGPTITHTYTATGSFTVTLRVWNGCDQEVVPYHLTVVAPAPRYFAYLPLVLRNAGR